MCWKAQHISEGVPLMIFSRDRILTTHVGSLPRNEKLSDLLLRQEAGETFDAKEMAAEMDKAVGHVVERQLAAGIEHRHQGGLLLQIDAPDLAMDRTMMYRDLSDAQFVKAVERHVQAINDGIAGIPRDRVRLHICYGNWEGPHVHDVPLATILPALYQAKVGALSIEFSNPRHAHEYEALKKYPLPKDMLLIPGVVETTSNFVEHPEVVARRIEEAVRTVGERERVIASTDCGFGTFTNREWVIEPAVWLKLASIRQGADITSARL